jgi:16S rRNA (cytosine967-C5)-methyltransferase
MSQPDKGAAARAVAARALDGVIAQGRNLDDSLLAGGVDKLPTRDQPLARSLAYGAVRFHLRNARVIQALVDRPFRNRDSLIVALISVGLFALTKSRQPDYAVVSASVAAAAVLGKPRMKGVVNALLRRFLRERDELLAQADTHEDALWLHPDWLIERIRTDWPDDWQDILAAANVQAPMWLRINRQRNSRADWLANSGQAVADLPGAVPEAVMLAEPVPVEALQGFGEGACSVQDVAAQLASPLLRSQPGMRILDACAAPGGKATHILELCPDIAELIALDRSAERLLSVTANMERLGLAATVIQGDAAAPNEWWDGGLFDRILLDAPCSATGVIRRHPDIRFLRRPGDIESLQQTQLEILRALWPLLRPGGLLLYSTCSVLRAENEQVVSLFMRDRDDLNMVELQNEDALKYALAAGSGMQLLPGSPANDGFYYALMERSASVD